MFFLEPGLEERPEVCAQGFDWQEELGIGRDPGSSVGAQASAGHQIVNVGMKDERTRPGMQHAQHCQIGSQSAGVARQFLHGLSTAPKEQVQGDLLVGADKPAQGFGHREGEQEVGRGQEQPPLLAFEPGIRVGLATLRAVPVVARVITIVKARAVRTLEELSTHSGAATGHDLFQDLPVPLRHGRSKALAVIRRQLSEQLLNRQALTTVAGGTVHQRLAMKLSSRF